MKTILKYKKKILLVVLLALVAAGVWAWKRTDQDVAPTYREAKAKRGDIELTISATGTVKPRNRLEIKPPVAGRIEDVNVREGQVVARGQLLATMSSSERAALLDAASAKGADELKRWEELYRATPIYAPMSGTVIARDVEPGQTIGTTDVALVMSDRLVVKAQVDETDIARIKTGQEARIVLDAYADQVVTAIVGQVAFDATTVENVTTYEVDVLPQKLPPFMRSGMTANVNFLLSARQNVVIVPTEAVLRRDGGTRVLLPAVGKDKPEAREVKTGISDGRRTEILIGLNEGDAVLVPTLAANKRATPGSAFGQPTGRPGAGRR